MDRFSFDYWKQHSLTNASFSAWHDDDPRTRSIKRFITTDVYAAYLKKKAAAKDTKLDKPPAIKTKGSVRWWNGVMRRWKARVHVYAQS